jgi:hypothetical protein
MIDTQLLTLEAWAAKWGVPAAALVDLAHSVIYTPEADEPSSASEARVQSEVRLEAPHHGVYLFRNNVGAGKLASGNFVRFGLGNDTAKLNEALKSGDLIGIRKRQIVQADVGRYIGQFYSREIKRRDWRYSGTMEENAQLRWATLVNAQGGDAKIVTGKGSFTD